MTGVLKIYYCDVYICVTNQLGDADVVVDVDDMLGDIGSDGGGGHRDSRRRQEWPQSSDRDSNAARGNGLDIQANSSQQNVFGFITDWITSVSFMKGI